jgi:phosphoadenosine phosphosulfate reductase
MHVRTFSALDRASSVDSLARTYGALPTVELLVALIRKEFPGGIALVSAFGTESAVLLHLVATIDPTVPVVFLDTGKHFDETLAYRDRLVAQLGFSDIRVVSPASGHLKADDPAGNLHSVNPDLCCYIRKTLPMVRALREFSCWISGRKRFQASTRATLQLFEVQDRWIKVNPLVDWSEDQLQNYFVAHDLPRHPLEAFGYASVGCLPCTAPAAVEGSNGRRSGRWRGSAKVECGIHLPIARAAASSE